ncbi:MAG: hypothetical protein H7270_07845 [Dermatophilaceae bacterium]|nr:hypothetical protein [Dermatophilaceae bacterium]
MLAERSVVVLKDFGHCGLSSEMIKRQGEQTESCLGTKALAMMAQAEPGRGGHFSDDREVP